MARLLPEVGGVCMNAESELEAVGHGVGRRRDRDAGRRPVRSGRDSRSCRSPCRRSATPACRWSCSTWPEARVTTSRPPGEAGTATTATSCWRPATFPRRCVWSSWPSTWPIGGAIRCMFLGRLLPGPRAGGRRDRTARFRPAPGEGLGPRRLERRLGSRQDDLAHQPEQARAIRTPSSYGTPPGHDRRAHRAMAEGVEPHGRGHRQPTTRS